VTGLCLLLDVEPWSSPTGDRIRAAIEIHAGPATILYVEKLKVQADEEPETARPKKTAMVAFRSAARALELDPEVLSGADRSWEVSRYRALIGYVLIRRLGYKLKDVAKCLGRDMATVSSLVSRYSERIADDEELKNQSTRIAKHCLE